MKHRMVLLFLSVTTLLFLTSGVNDILSSGAPVGSTGAPGEQTCAKSGCHTGKDGANNLNTGAGKLSILGSPALSGYLPDSIYDIQVLVEEADIERFGFSLTVLDSNHQKAGKLILSDEQRTQIFEGAHQYAGRDYITYRNISTNPYEPGKGLWRFKWKAPAQAAGKITFYAAAISANNDATDYGDQVYTQTLVSGNLVPGFQTEPSVSVFPNPARDQVHIEFRHAISELLFLSIYDQQGRLQHKVTDAEALPGGKTIRFSVSNLLPGLYFLKAENSTLSVTQKILVIH